MNRRDFANLAAAAGLASAGLPSNAQAQTLGEPHPPLVPEDDPTIVVDRPQIRRLDGTLSAYAAYPATQRSNTPGLVIAMPIWGVDAQLRDTVRRFAKAGFNCIAPNLYSRLNAPSGDGADDIAVFRPFAAKLDRKQYNGDLRAAGLSLKVKAPDSKLGIVGFCMGGHIALIQAVDNADIFEAVAPFYGAIKDISALSVSIPVCGSYGEDDASIPAQDVRNWATALRVPNDIVVYPNAGHAFFDDTRPSYVGAAATDAWTRTVAFMRRILGSSR